MPHLLVTNNFSLVTQRSKPEERHFSVQRLLGVKTDAPGNTSLQRPGTSLRRVPHVHRRQDPHAGTQPRDVRRSGWSPLRPFETAGNFTGAVHRCNQDVCVTGLGQGALKKARTGSSPSASFSEGSGQGVRVSIGLAAVLGTACSSPGFSLSLPLGIQLLI